MDTSQTILIPRVVQLEVKKPDNLSKEELTVVLKYGIADVSAKPYFFVVVCGGLLSVYRRFDKDDSTQSKKLDDILSRAEDHETTQTGDSVVLPWVARASLLNLPTPE
jgi:chromodomain-helicase-DNA-binding protein 1